MRSYENQLDHWGMFDEQVKDLLWNAKAICLIHFALSQMLFCKKDIQHCLDVFDLLTHQFISFSHAALPSPFVFLHPSIFPNPSAFDILQIIPNLVSAHSPLSESESRLDQSIIPLLNFDSFFIYLMNSKFAKLIDF